MLKKSILNLKRKREESLVLLQEEMAKRKTEETLADSLNEITGKLNHGQMIMSRNSEYLLNFRDLSMFLKNR